MCSLVLVNMSVNPDASFERDVELGETPPPQNPDHVGFNDEEDIAVSQFGSTIDVMDMLKDLTTSVSVLSRHQKHRCLRQEKQEEAFKVMQNSLAKAVDMLAKKVNHECKLAAQPGVVGKAR